MVWLARHVRLRCPGSVGASYRADTSRLVRFAQALKEPAFAPRSVLAAKDARTLARDLLALSPPELSAAFKGSAMRRATQSGLRRNAAVVLDNTGTADRS